MKRLKLFLFLISTFFILSSQNNVNKFYFYYVNDNGEEYYRIDHIIDSNTYRKISSYNFSKQNYDFIDSSIWNYRIESGNIYKIENGLVNGEQLLMSTNFNDTIIKVRYSNSIVNNIFSEKNYFFIINYVDDIDPPIIYGFIHENIREGIKIMYYDHNFVLYKSFGLYFGEIVPEIERLDKIPIKLKQKIKQCFNFSVL